ncbi:MAG: hypothetical protein K2I48_10325 [Muribaculaceae bacterium]|nr:hypothetical protein [Muribaculaceae bacterium]
MKHSPRHVVALLAIVIISSIFGICRDAYAQSKAAAAKSHPAGKQKDEYHRPEPTAPFTPQIPSSNRLRPDKVFLEQADSIIKPAVAGTDRQIVKGNVRFRQMGTWMYCDSAWYFPEQNSLDAFGNVRMEQGDTLFVYADKLFYDGTSRFARLHCGPSEREVRIINRNVSLTTDSLDYDLAAELAWYSRGGVLRDEVNTLTSVYGQYSPATKDAEFFHNVVLVGEQNDFRLTTDTLYYNTATHIARIETPTVITTTEDEILTSDGYYNTTSGVAELRSRSIVSHTDSLQRTTTLEGDSIVYDPETRISRAFQFRGPGKNGKPVVITDTARKAVLIGGYGYYNDMTREAMATVYPLMMEYSRGDTLFLRADTILTRLLPRPQPAPQLPDSIAALAAMTQAASTGIEAEGTEAIGEIAGIAEERHAEEQNSEESPEESETPLTAVAIPAEPVRIEPDSTASTQPTDSMWHYAKAWPRARFFRTDIQGVADTIVFTEIDSLLRLKRRPVAWNEERQVRGDTIIVHLNDSTADWAHIPGHAKMMEHVEEDFYNQLHADKMMMWFADGTLRRLEAEGSVETIMLPQESDSTFNRLVYAESSTLSIDMADGQLERLKMWPEVSGTVTPLFLVKRENQRMLPGAVWLDAIRPRREWYGGRLRWADDLGEVPEELEL